MVALYDILHCGCGYINLCGSRWTENHISRVFSKPVTEIIEWTGKVSAIGFRRYLMTFLALGINGRLRSA